MTTKRDYPLLFSGPLVRAILASRKSWLVPEPYRSQRDRILARLAEIRKEMGQ